MVVGQIQRNEGGGLDCGLEGSGELGYSWGI